MDTIIALPSRIAGAFTLNLKLSKERALMLCLLITFAAMIAEFIGGYFTASLMLFSDGIHMLSHAASLFVSWLALYLVKKYDGKRFPFGMKRVEVLAAFINGLSLLFFVGYIVYAAIVRLIDPQPIEVGVTLTVAVVGLIVNLVTAFVLSLAGLEDLNTRSAFLHMLADTFSSLAIIGGGIIIYYTGWFQVDAILSFVVALVIAKWSIGLLKTSATILAESSPLHIDQETICKDLYGRHDAILSIDEVKVWTIGENEVAANLLIRVYPAEVYEYKRIKREIRQRMRSKFGVTHLAVELEW
ncbi:MAG: cation diffusion facilitator family transporter [Bacteroidota bacterium]